MFTLRGIVNSVRAVRVTSPRNVRGASASTAQRTKNNSLATALMGGISGGLLALVGGYTWYHFSGARDVTSRIQETKAYFENTTQKMKDSSPEPNEALQWLRDVANTYAAFIPGAKGYVNSLFNDLDAIHDKNRDEADRIISHAYKEMKGVSEKGMSIGTAQESWAILENCLGQIRDLAGDAAEDILKNHPAIKEKLGCDLDQLKRMGDMYGPEAKKQVNLAWEQVQDIIKKGDGMESADKISSMIQEKKALIKMIGDEAWKKGMEQAEPLLKRSPEVKEVIEKNTDSLKREDPRGVYQLVKKAVDSGNIDTLKGYIKKVVDKGEQSDNPVDQNMNKMLGGDKVVLKNSRLQDIAQKHGGDAEKIAEALEEVQQILRRKVDEAQDLAEKAAKNAK